LPSPQRQARIATMRDHVKSHISMLTEELNIFFDCPVGIVAEKSYFEAIEDKLCELAEYKGMLETIETEFDNGK